MALKPDEITAILRRQIQEFESTIGVEQIGSVLVVGDGIARVYGLEDAMAGELLEFPGEVYGMALNLEKDNIGCVILGPYDHIKEGDPVKRTGRIVEVPVGEAMIGRVVNPVGQPIDGKDQSPRTNIVRLRIAPLALLNVKRCMNRFKLV